MHIADCDRWLSVPAGVIMEPVGTALALLGALAACVLLSKVARWAATLRALSSLPHPKMGFLGAWELLQDGGDHMAQVCPPAAPTRQFCPATRCCGILLRRSYTFCGSLR
jgi:hypothetical protein